MQSSDTGGFGYFEHDQVGMIHEAGAWRVAVDETGFPFQLPSEFYFTQGHFGRPRIIDFVGEDAVVASGENGLPQVRASYDSKFRPLQPVLKSIEHPGSPSRI